MAAGKSGTGRSETAKLSRGFGWPAALGVILVLAGLVGLVCTGVATLTSMLLFGWLLLIGDGGTARSSDVRDWGRSDCCTRSRPAAPTSSGSAWSSRP